jgi:hypothetical protein
MSVYRLNPLEDPRWDRLVARHPLASIFHTAGWLRALRLTYGYEPVALTTSPPGDELHDALVYCRVRSWITGRRIVSLPFTDHCDPLVEHIEQRRRHGVPPQPFSWFRDLAAELKDALLVRIVHHRRRPVAAMLCGLSD